jgi:MFS family permease
MAVSTGNSRSRDGVRSAPSSAESIEVPLQLFSPAVRFQTLVGVLFALGTLLAVWTAGAWLPTIQSLLIEREGIKGAAAIPYISWGMRLWGLGGIVGYIAFGYIADIIGRRPTIVIYSVGTLIFGLSLFRPMCARPRWRSATARDGSSPASGRW